MSESSSGFTLAPSGFTCHEYTSIKGEKFKVSILIVPVSIRIGSGLRIVWCCNRGLHYYNPSCTYSRMNRRSKRG